jgi:hairy and enhancer of split related with YRPW motif
MSLKRKLSEVEEDYSDYDDDVCSVTRSEDAAGGACLGGPDNRKRRRGQIEKKRRDRINDSLGELKRLVPSAIEKSSSTKLEKAEILQMTVEYLKSMQQSGGRDYPVDHHRVAMDYHAIGFRDCAAEVSRYLITVEGMDVQDPLRLRLMSHLHAYGAPRGSAGAAPPNGWATAGYAAVAAPHQHHHQPHHHHHYAAEVKGGLEAGHLFPEAGSHGTTVGYGRIGGSAHVATTTTAGGTSYSHTAGYANYAGFPSIALPPPGSYSPPQGKPYRPWGAEMAY